jgi:ABC-2 type transport system ATP-binding protein
MDDLAVKLADVTKRFGTQVAVDNLQLAIPRGMIYGFIGPNGSGKTTTLRMILRIIKPDSGIVEVLGKNAGEAADDRVGYLPEERGLYHRMSVRKVLRFFAKLKGCHKPDASIEEWLERLGTAAFAHKKVEQLSKGMAQKVQFIAAVVAKPELLILDEPFSGLDPVNLDILRDAIIHLRKQGTTIVISTHDMDVAEKLCDRLLMIYKGRKILDGTIEEISQQYGEPTLRVRMKDNANISASLPMVRSMTDDGRFTELKLESLDVRSQVLSQLMTLGDVEHFETVRPTLRDIFVRIVGRDDAQVAPQASPQEVTS